MASVKTNKNKNPTPLLKTNFGTLLFGLKRFLHSKGPKNVIVLTDPIFKIAISSNPAQKILEIFAFWHSLTMLNHIRGHLYTSTIFW